ncbi:MAG: hypothetical protein Q9213_004714, partial [Squamulea squamosa]
MHHQQQPRQGLTQQQTSQSQQPQQPQSAFDILFERTALALANTPSFFYELLYHEPIIPKGAKHPNPLKAMMSSWMGFLREKQAERVVL